MAADGHGLLGIVEGVGATEVELGVVAVVGDGDGGVGAGEGEHALDGGVIRGVADGHALEYGVGDVGAALVPLDDEGLAGGDGRGVVEVQGQRAVGEVARRGVERHGLHVVAAEGAARRADVEGQAEGVPRAVLVEGAAAEDDVGGLAVVEGVDAVGVLHVGVTVVVEEHVHAHELQAVQLAQVADGTFGEDFGAVPHGLAVGYCYGAAVGGADAAGGDAVVGAGPAEGDGGAAAGRGVDAGGVGGGGGELSAEDAVRYADDGAGFIAVGGDGEGAAQEGDVGADAIHPGAGGGGGNADVAAVLLVVGNIDAIRCAVVAEGAGVVVEALAVDGKVVVSCDALRVAVEGHGLAVGEDEGDVVVEVDSVGVGDVGADVVGAGGEAYAATPTHGLMSVEGYGLCGLCGAVGCHVADLVLLSVAEEGGGVDADGHVLVGHGECGAAEGACAGGVAVLVAEGCAGGGVAEGEAELVVDAVVEGLAALQASAAVGGDAADGVLGRCAGEGDGLDGDVGACCHAMACLALGGAEGLGVVAVDGGDVTTAIVVERAAADAGAVLRGEERVLNHLCAVAVSYEAAAVCSADYLAVEHAALYLDVAADAEAACVASAADVNVADTVGDMACGVDCLADDARCTVGGSADGAADNQVLYRCAVHITERSRHCVVVRVGIVDGQRVAAAVEGAGEFMAAAARHAGDGDVGAELDGLTAEAVPSVVVLQGEAEGVPSGGVADGVGLRCAAVVARAEAGLNVLGLRGGAEGHAVEGIILRVGQRAVVDVAAAVLEVFAVADGHRFVADAHPTAAGGGEGAAVEGNAAGDGVTSDAFIASERSGAAVHDEVAVKAVTVV